MTLTTTEQQAAPDTAPAALSDVSNWVLQYLEMKHPETRGTLHTDTSFDSVGLDSQARVDMISAMERRFGITLDPTLAYDFVTAGALASFVWSQISGVPIDEKLLMGI